MATGGTDSGVETGNESNDLDDISINVNVSDELEGGGDSFSPSSSSFECGLTQLLISGGGGDDKDVPPPPPPPTSPNPCANPSLSSSTSGHPLDEMQGGGALQQPQEQQEPFSSSSCSYPLYLSSSQPQGPSNLMNKESLAMINEDVMERDDLQLLPPRDQQGGDLLTSPQTLPFIFAHYNIQAPPSQSFNCGEGGGGEGGEEEFESGSSMDHCPSPVQCSTPFPHCFYSSGSSGTATNTCRALVKFELSELEVPTLPRLVVCDFAEPPAGLQSFLNVQPFFNSSTQSQNNNSAGYGILNTAPSTSDCRSLIPYEQRDLTQKVRTHTRTIRNKLYDNWSNMRKEYNERRLRTAAGGGGSVMVQKLISAGVDVNAADELGRTALHIAACKGHTEVVKVLLQGGANPNQKDAVGNTPLHLSACTHHYEVVTCLLQAGTDVSTLDNNGRNPLQLAQSKLKMIAQTSCGGGGDLDSAGAKVKREVQQIVEMMLAYLQKKGQDLEIELLNDFAKRLNLSHTPQEVDELLVNLSSLKITSGRSRAMTNPIRAPPTRHPYLQQAASFSSQFERPRSASFSAPSSASTSGSSSSLGGGDSSSSPSSSKGILAPAKLLCRQNPTVNEEQQQLINELASQRSS